MGGHHSKPKNPFVSAYDATKKAAEDAANRAKKVAEDAANKAKKAEEDAAAAAKKAADDAAAAAEKLLQDTLNAEAEIKNIINSEIDAIKNDIQNTLMGQIDTMKTGIQNNLENEINNMTTEVTNEINTTLISKFTSFFSQIGDIFQNAIIQPILAFFIGIADIFVQLFNLLKMIADKIESLPTCIPFYIFDTITSFIINTIKNILPSFIFNFFNNLYNLTLGVIVVWILDFIGWTDADQRCYSFNTDSEISKMRDDAENIGNSFTSGFGDINFTQLII